MSDGPVIEMPFAPQRTAGREEIAANAVRWAKVAKQELPSNVGFVMIMFAKGEVGQGRGVCVGNVRDEALRRELEAVLRRFAEHRRVVLPGEA